MLFIKSSQRHPIGHEGKYNRPINLEHVFSFSKDKRKNDSKRVLFEIVFLSVGTIETWAYQDEYMRNHDYNMIMEKVGLRNSKDIEEQ